MTPHPNPPSLERAAQRVLSHVRGGPAHAFVGSVVAVASAISDLHGALAAHREQRKRIVEVLKDLTVLAADRVALAAVRDLDRRATALLSELEEEQT